MTKKECNQTDGHTNDLVIGWSPNVIVLDKKTKWPNHMFKQKPVKSPEGFSYSKLDSNQDSRLSFILSQVVSLDCQSEETMR